MSSEEGAVIVRAQAAVAARLRAACMGGKDPVSYVFKGTLSTYRKFSGLFVFMG